MMDKETIEQTLAGNAFFSALAQEHVEFLAAHARLRELPLEQTLFRYGDRANHFYLVVSGRLSVEVAAIEGPPLELQDLGAGDVVGWSWLIAPHKWAFQARAVTELSVLEFDGDAVLAHCEEDPRFGYELLKCFSALMSDRLHHARQKMMEEWRPPGFA